MLRLSRGLFLRGGLGFHAARAVKAGPAGGGVLHDLFVDVGILNHGLVHPGHGRVIAEGIAHPFTAIVAAPSVAEAVIDSTIEADRRAPVAVVEDVKAVAVAPVTGRPQQPDTRRSDPDARDPVITEWTIGPVARGPN